MIGAGVRRRDALDRFDDAARHVLAAAWDEAERQGDTAVGTEYLMVALAGVDPDNARLLAAMGITAPALRGAFVATRHPPRRADQRTLLSTLGVDLDTVRQRATRTFGLDAIAHAAVRARPQQTRRPLRSYISCSRPLAPRRGESPLAGRHLEPIPRVTRLLRRAARSARPQLASPAHILAALLEGNEPACELLDALGADRSALAQSVRRWLARRERPHTA